MFHVLREVVVEQKTFVEYLLTLDCKSFQIQKSNRKTNWKSQLTLITPWFVLVLLRWLYFGSILAIEIEICAKIL